MKTASITVVPYDAAWRDAFDAIKKELEEALGDLSLGVEHVGSTSVVGMWAKPCIDLDVVIRDDSVLDEVVARLALIGYFHEGDLGIKGREAFKYTNKPHLMAHHLYVCPRDSEELARHVTFRNYLRANPEAVRAYSNVKRRAAELFPNDIDGYCNHKSPCIAALYEACGLKR